MEMPGYTRAERLGVASPPLTFQFLLYGQLMCRLDLIDLSLCSAKTREIFSSRRHVIFIGRCRLPMQIPPVPGTVNHAAPHSQTAGWIRGAILRGPGTHISMEADRRYLNHLEK